MLHFPSAILNAPSFIHYKITTIMTNYTLHERFVAARPKRVLALDGGGIRGALTLGYLEHVEKLLQQRHQNPDFKLCDYFDLIGGTSTGSIIAGGLAVGMSVAEIRQRYSELGATIFGKTRLLHLFRQAKFDHAALEKGLQNTFGDICLGDDTLKTGICIFAKRVDTQSLWTLNNNPNFPYYDYDKKIKLWEAIRASAAAPTYFEPVDLEALSDGEELTVRGIFTDGGISPANNPALHLLMMTQVSKYGFNWKGTTDDLLVVSVGTGRSEIKYDKKKVSDWTTLNWASTIPNMMMADASDYNEIIMQLLSQSPTRRHYDSVMKDLSGELLGRTPICTYLRYNFLMSLSNFQALGGSYANLDEDEIEDLTDFTKGENVDQLYEIGKMVGEKEVNATHFPFAFDV